MCPRLLRAAMPRGRQVALVRLRERELAVKEREQEIKHREVETKAGCMARHATNTAVAIRPAAPVFLRGYPPDLIDPGLCSGSAGQPPRHSP